MVMSNARKIHEDIPLAKGAGNVADSRIQHFPHGVWVKARIPDMWIRQASGEPATIEWRSDGLVVLDPKIPWENHRDALPPTW